MKHHILIHPAPFPSIGHMIALWNADQITFEINDHFEKQTYRNRYYILGAHGKHLLSIPVKHSKSNEHRPTKNIRIANEFDWQKQHWKSIQTAYRSSPYFEYFEDRIAPLYHQTFDKLIDFNMETIKLILNLLDKNISFYFTDKFEKETSLHNFRYLIDAKTKQSFTAELTPYFQVFSDRHPFIPGLSILDLLFMLGPETATYLENHKNLLY